ncbi:putative glutamate--cysteine ligase 2-3 [Glutamicibacter uratoxydans]|uniref:Putative glutamate--cysteine ligase 2 n=1 Tax=Glutamicibacter uratoxydans TaxID=43667 RepID=A0A4Y4DMD7_GLUUR|nr:YbdK family carboxylate-amine ligase [Glutamicibacter uratoxydans]GED05024.1 putative glutamate--cysteine ligase 2-3 [Glutamicibacter uratoxydans]
MERTFGLEEEYFFVDRESYLPTPIPASLRRELSAMHVLGTSVQTELLECQLEVVTDVFLRRGDALEALVERRQKIDAVCRKVGYLLLAVGTPVMLPTQITVTDSGRYDQIHHFVPGIVREHYINGLHIHLGIPDDLAGIRVMNGLRIWLPKLAAITANSPLWDGQLSGFESWRTVHYRRWSVIGIPPFFANVGDYRTHRHDLLASAALLDSGHIGWAVRLSEHHPTVEVRVADSQMTAGESVAFALLVRAIADTILENHQQVFVPHEELLNLSLWQAAKSGLAGPHFDSLTGRLLDAAEIVSSLLQFAGPKLDFYGDFDFVQTYLTFWQRQGNGAQRQRLSWDNGGAVCVVEESAKRFAFEG